MERILRQRRIAALLLGGLAVAIGGLTPTPLVAQTPSLTGTWTLDRQASQFPREVGFNTDFGSIARAGSGAEGGGERAGGSGGDLGGSLLRRPQSEEDARRERLLVGEVRTPPVRLTIEETPIGLSIADERGQSRALKPDGSRSVLEIGGIPVVTMARWDAGRLVVLYQVQQGRELRYTYSRTTSPAQLVVEVRFVEHGTGDSVKRVYVPAAAVAPETTATPAPRTTSAPPASPAPSNQPTNPGMPASGQPTQPGDVQRPGSELRGLQKLGLVVEDLGGDAVACGLKQALLENTALESLTDAGFKVVKNADEDTYVYINVMTGSISAGLCVSRYDVWVYSNTTATLSHQSKPVLIQASLLHKGGLAGGAPAAHADSVVRGVKSYVEAFASRIRDANAP